MPTIIKVENQLEKFKEIRFKYDFGDDWNSIFKLEEIVADYYFGYPMLLDGGETASPEGLGRINGFYDGLPFYK